MKLQLVYDLLNIMYSNFHRNILKDVEDITKSVRSLVRNFDQCIGITLSVKSRPVTMCLQYLFNQCRYSLETSNKYEYH